MTIFPTSHRGLRQLGSTLRKVIPKRIPQRVSARRVTAAVMTLVILVGGVGLPALPFAAKQGGTPYPCQSCACACQTATSCWDGCCCLTDQEKMAWALEHGVRPPEVFLQRIAIANETLGGDEVADCELCLSTPTSDSPTKSSGVVSLDAERRCRGLGFLASTLSIALPAEPEAVFALPAQVQRFQPLSPPLALKLGEQPPEPPPRVL